MLQRMRRGPGLHSSFLGLETLLGSDETIEFDDFLSGLFGVVVVCDIIYRSATP